MPIPGLPSRAPGAKPRDRARVLVWGDSSAGKTHGACSFPNSYYIDPEHGAAEAQFQSQLAAGKCEYMGVDEGAREPEKIIQTVQKLSQVKHSLTWLIVDSLTKLFMDQIAADYDKMLRSGRDMDKTFGAEKKGAIGFVRRLIHWADVMNMNVMFLCHRKAQWRDGKEIGDTFDGWDKLEYELHLALRIVNRNAIVTKTRYNEFPKNESFAWNYGEFASRYGRSVIEAPTAPIQLATPEQVAELEALLSVRVDGPTLRDKWLEKADAESFSEMKADDLAKCIAFLKPKAEAGVQAGNGSAKKEKVKV